MNTPPPMPNRPPIRPIQAPIQMPPMIFPGVYPVPVLDSAAVDINMRPPAAARTMAMVIRKIFRSMRIFKYDPMGAARLDERIKGMDREKSTIFFRE